ncbi:dicarboxylate/amino acid:cation symporter [Chondromyces apiculatus]|uniref:Proton/glutamate symport protein n=1 Tax=Chondromyces apiculatus DSM 436 TaxID=1192034 RepID=A0A017T552_9BACT|nr:dicarboxylate/amino acid:cation symporter [Chondromyces apiculatus]EYF04107.1 Proton/glutamate symport protein [Chondromyces apiculatus DSM 436]
MSPQLKMLLGIGVGAAAGLAANGLAAGAPWLNWVIDHLTYPAGQIFLRLLFMLVIPMLFSALVMGISEIDLRHLGRLGARTLGYTVVISTIAVLIGLFLVNVLQPGEGLPDALRDAARGGAVTAAAAPADASPVALIIGMFPDNVIKAAASGDMLALITFSLFFGVGLTLTRTEAAARLRETIQGLYDVTTRLIDAVISLAPIGVAALLFTMTSRLGVHILVQLAAYVGTVLLGLGVHMFVVYSLSVRFFGGMSPIAFFRGCRVAILTAFSTASSSATLPTALRVAEEELHLPPHVSRFVLTAGSAMNQNGTALFEGITVLFLAQLYGVHLPLSKQAIVMLICILGGIGTAGMPGGSLPVVAMILGMFNIPVEGLGLILGVDRFLDMCRTVLNVTGDLAAAVYVSRGEPHLSGQADDTQGAAAEGREEQDKGERAPSGEDGGKRDA